MRRPALPAGLTGLAGAAAFGVQAHTISATSDPVTALESTLLDPPHASGIPVALAELHHDVTRARALFQHGRYADVAARLPGLFSTASTTRAAGASDQHAARAMVKLGNDRRLRLREHPLPGHCATRLGDRATTRRPRPDRPTT